MLEQFVWLDVFFIILLLGTVYKGSQMGVGAQMLSLAGYLFLLYVVMGHYIMVSEALFGFLLQNWAKPFSFVILTITVFFFIKVIQRLFSATGQEQMAVIERAGGMLVALFRSGILIGIISTALLLVPSERVNALAAEASFFSRHFVSMNLKVYSGIRNITRTDIPGQEVHKDILFRYE